MRNYYLTIDTETANGFDDPIVYDIGGCIHDKKGRVYETFSFVIYDTFFGMKDVMQYAYFADKFPQYEMDIKNGKRTVVRFMTARNHIHELCKKYCVKAIIAHNMRFDYNALTTTQRYITKSKYRYFFPYGIELWDTLEMSKSAVLPKRDYKNFCKDNGYETKFHRPQLTAEVLYRYITGENDFVEEHTALADVLIEKEIFAYCMRQKVRLQKKCFH